MKKAKFWFRASLIVSSMLVVFGAYFILIYGSLMDGLVHIGLEVAELKEEDMPVI